MPKDELDLEDPLEAVAVELPCDAMALSPTAVQPLTPVACAL